MVKLKGLLNTNEIDLMFNNLYKKGYKGRNIEYAFAESN